MKLHNPWFLLLLMGVLAALAQLVFPWWSLAVVAFALGFLLARSGKVAFWAAFGGVGLSWLLPALWLSSRNDGLLAQRMANLLPLGGSAGTMVLVTGVLGALVGGLAALAGQWLRVAVQGPAVVEPSAARPPQVR